MQRAEEALGAPVLEAYGMTEASHQMASNPLPPAPRKPGSVGVPSGVEIRIVDGQGRSLEQGASGEVAIKGPGVTSGYLNNPEANAESFFDGWFRTGDRGSFDEDGYLRLEGRLKEMILRGGENISPYEIEEVLLGHPAVADAICFGIDDEKYGERVGAAVALSGAATERELIDYCRERLAAFKVPEVVHVLDAIPRTPTGKVQRKRVGARSVGGRRVRFAILGAGAIGAYVGAALARGGSDVTLIARGAHLQAHAGARRPGAEPARRLRGAPGRDRRPRRDLRRRRRLHRAEGPQPARARAADRRRPEAWGGRDRRPERHPVVVLPVAPGAARGHRARVGRPRRRDRGLDPLEAVIGCVIYCSTEIVEPGVIRHIEGTRFAIGEPGGEPSARCAADLCRRSSPAASSARSRRGSAIRSGSS